MAGLITRKGAAVTFTSATAGVFDPLTETTTGSSVVTVSGHAMQVDGDPDMYKDLGLIESDSPTLLFKPTTVGQVPVLGATCVWGGQTFTVKGRKSLAMAGTATASLLVVG